MTKFYDLDFSLLERAFQIAADLITLEAISAEGTYKREVSLIFVKETIYGGARVKQTESKRVALWLMEIFVAPQAAKGWRTHMLGTKWISDTFAVNPEEITRAKRILTDKGILKVWKHANKETGTPARYIVCDAFLY